MPWNLLPQKGGFFDLFSEQGEKAKEASELFNQMARDLGQAISWANRLKEKEKEADHLVHTIKKLLSKTFITPFDREDIQGLADVIDDIIDTIEEAANRLFLYQITVPLPALTTLAVLITKACQEIFWGTKHLKTLRKHPDRLALCCKNLNDFEEEGDAIHRASLSLVINCDMDLLWKIKWLEILQLCEDILDKCEDAANVFETIALKWS